jgi:hypothetical protein
MYIRNREPPIDELLNDPVMQLVMARDGVSDAALLAMMAELGERLRGRLASTALEGTVP